MIIRRPPHRMRRNPSGRGRSDAPTMSRALKSEINAELREAGMDGNGRFEKPSHALSELASILHSHGVGIEYTNSYSLNTQPKGGLIMLLHEYIRYPDGSLDPGREIENARVQFTWHELRPYKFEVICYIG